MRPAYRSLGILVGVLVVYFAIPTRELSASWETLLSVVWLVVGVVVLGVLITSQVRRHLASGDDDSVEIENLLILAYLAVLVFALGYYLLELSAEDQFAGLDTKIDSLYFTVTTLGTVGFGDVRPTGQLSRALVTAQIVFNLVFVGALVSLLTNRIRRRAATRAPK